ncbi:MAG: pyridoxal-phosphate dependent enzyme, partial [Arenicella sp.]|nr:pyridoxal-phosphate dependent enzyme [Arenicella sp.]
ATIAEGTAIQRPVRLKEMLHALRDSDGGTVAIEEQDITDTALKLARQGLYVEPTCAHAVAGFTQLVEQGQIEREQETVIVLTGTGLKATSFYLSQ